MPVDAHATVGEPWLLERVVRADTWGLAVRDLRTLPPRNDSASMRIASASMSFLRSHCVSAGKDPRPISALDNDFSVFPVYSR